MSKSIFGLCKQSSLCIEMKCGSVIKLSHCFETHLNLPRDFTGSLERMLMIRSVGSEGSITSSETTSCWDDDTSDGGEDDEGGGDGIRIGGFFFIFSSFFARSYRERINCGLISQLLS